MEPQQRNAPDAARRDGRPSSRQVGRRRELVAGAVAITLTVLTAGVAVGVNFGAANADVPSPAGAFQTTGSVRDVVETTPTSVAGAQGSTGAAGAAASTSIADHDALEQEERSTGEEQRELQEGHDDDD